MRRLVTIAAMFWASVASGQFTNELLIVDDLDNPQATTRQQSPEQVTSVTRTPASSAPAGILRALDKVSGATRDFVVPASTEAEIFGLTVLLSDCRYPSDDPDGDAVAFVTVRETDATKVWFEGWMFASAPALSALDHGRYDVWVVGCDVPQPAEN